MKQIRWSWVQERKPSEVCHFVESVVPRFSVSTCVAVVVAGVLSVDASFRKPCKHVCRACGFSVSFSKFHWNFSLVVNMREREKVTSSVCWCFHCWRVQGSLDSLKTFSLSSFSFEEIHLFKFP